MAEKKIS